MGMVTLQETVPAEGRSFYRASSWLLWAFSLLSRSLQPVPKHLGNRADLTQNLLAEEAAVETAIEVIRIQEADRQVLLRTQNTGTFINVRIAVIVAGIR
jgi:hypothetical protein